MGENVCVKPGVTEGTSRAVCAIPIDSEWWEGSIGNIHDGDDNTAHIAAAQDDATMAVARVDVMWTLTLPQNTYVKSIRALSRRYGEDSTGVDELNFRKVYCTRYLGGPLVQLYSATNLGLEGAKVETLIDVNDVIRSVSIRLGLDTYDTNGIARAYCALYELQAFYWDEPSEFKIKTASGIKQFAREHELNSRFRFRDSAGVIRSFYLVDTTSPIASPLRIKTPSGVKSVAYLVE